jgi:hypothetical protein
LDFAAIALSLALTVFSGFAVYSKPKPTTQVVIQGPSRGWVFPLDAEETVSVPGPLGTTVVEISGGRARVLSSPCDNQTCVAAGHIHAQGQWVACLPNNVFVLIEGSENGGGPVDTSAW